MVKQRSLRDIHKDDPYTVQWRIGPQDFEVEFDTFDEAKKKFDEVQFDAKWLFQGSALLEYDLREPQ